MRRFWILVFALSVLLTLTGTPVLAQGGRTVLGEPVTVESGETINGDVVAFGGSVTVERGAEVRGNVVAWGGSVTIAGLVEGDVTAWGGPVDLRDSAVVKGDVVATGGRVHRSPEAVVEGEIVQGLRLGDLRSFRFRFPPVPPPSVGPGVQRDVGNESGFLSFILSLLKIGFRTAGVAVIALLLLIFVPEQTYTVKQMAVDQPIASVGVGILTLVVAALVLGVLVITICGIPIALILGLALLMALLYGWIALGVMVGERLLTALNTERPLPLVSGVVGVLLITLLSSIPCLGWLVGFVGSSWGLGAVVLSRGGTRSYPSLPGGRAWKPAPTTSPPSGSTTVALPEVEEWPETSQESPPEAEVQAVDNLQAIHGIGPVYERMLMEAGVRTYRGLAMRSPQELVEAVAGPDVVPVSVEATQRWIEEARRLAGT